MSNINSEILFPDSGMDSDSDERWIRMGDSPYRLNILVSEDNAIGVITNMKGNSRTVDINDHLLKLSNTYVTIGSYYNRLTRKVYYWVFSQPYYIGSNTTTTTTPAPWEFEEEYLYDNRLFCYNEDTETLDLIFIDTKNYFGLDVNYPMRDCTMIGNWLYFNPRISEPKVIDVEMAYNYTNYDAYSLTKTYVYADRVTYMGGLWMANSAISAGQTPVTNPTKWDRVGDSYKDQTTLNFTSEFRYAFYVIKQPPVTRPKLAYGSDPKINFNKVRGQMFRFTYRYKYFDNSYSPYSAYSDVSLPVDDEEWNGQVLSNVTSNNYIEVTINLHSPALVKEVEIAFQQINYSWRRCKVINRIEQAVLTTNNFTYDFYNNEAYEVYSDDTEIKKIFDYVPQLATSQEIVNKNILCYGGCTEGFDNIPKDKIDVSLTPAIQEIKSIFGELVLRRDNIASGDISFLDAIWDDALETFIYYTIVDVGTWFAGAGMAAGDVYRITVNGTAGSVSFVPADVASAPALATAMGTAVNIDGWTAVGGTGSEQLWIGSYYQYAEVTVSRFYKPEVTKAALAKYRGFKTGASHPFCLFYYDDAMRRWDAQTSKENVFGSGYEILGTTVPIPFLTEYSPLPTSTNYKWQIDWKINHLPPTGAKYWRWGYAGNSLCSQFVQYIMGNDGIYNGTGEEINMSIIDIKPLQTLKDTDVSTWNQFPSSVMYPYSWQKGDRVRFITQKGSPTTPGSELGLLVDGVYDMEIIKQDTTNNTIYVQKFAWDAVGLNLGTCSLIEIYTPIQETTKEVFYEFGDLMPITKDADGVLVHSGLTQNQVAATNTPATGTLSGGDIYHILRTPSRPLDDANPTQNVFHESMWYSDFYTSDDWDRGKIGFETTFGQRFLNIIRYSRPYFQNTEINGLPTFEEAEGWAGYKELNDIYGNIVAIYEMGDTLKVYQERKASSILIGRTEYMDSTGAVNVAISTTVLGAIRYSPSNYSTIFPESIARNNKFIYGFDIYNGVVWRDSVNGLFPISGRYAEAGGDSDYKMQTYFKLKAKALMQSGVDHVDVLGVWDEEFKNFYLTFKDYVVEANNETIVFHEPSNRWICFADFNQTPEGGFNVPLELSYEIVKGFESGINFSFDEDIRFAIFEIVTPSNYNPGLSIAVLTITPYEPTVTVDCDATGDVGVVTIASFEPSCTITLAPSVTLSSVEYISPATVGSNLYAFVHYANPGDSTSGTLDWRIIDSELNVVDSGTTGAYNFATTADATVTISGLTYTSPAGIYYIEVKKSADVWTSAVSYSFTSL